MFRPIGTPVGLVAALATPSAAERPATGTVGDRVVTPAGAIKPTRTWGLASRAGNFVCVAGMCGIDPRTDVLVVGEEARVRQAFLTMTLIAESEGAALKDAVRLVVSVTDMFRFRPLSTRSRPSCGAPAPTRRAPSSRRTGSTRTTSSRLRGRSGWRGRGGKPTSDLLRYSGNEN